MNINSSFPSNYLKADGDIPEDENLVLTIKTVKMETVGKDDDAEDKPVVYFRETDKGLVLNKTNATTISSLYGPETDEWIGKKVALFATEVSFSGRQVMAIRVRMKKPRTDAPSVTAAPPPKTDETDPFADE